MRGRTPYDQVAAEAGLGARRRVYRTARRVSYGLSVAFAAVVLVLAGAWGWTWWAFLLALVIAAGAGWLYREFPPSTGLRAVAHYEGGLVLAAAGSYMPALPWEAIESYEFVPARFEYRGNLQTEHFARLVLRLRGADEPVVLMHLRGKEGELARAVDAALIPRRTAALHQKFTEQGHVVFGTVLGVLPTGLLIGPSEYHRKDPLPWADLDLVGSRGAFQLNLTATKDLNPGSRSVSCEVPDAPAVVDFLLEVCDAMLKNPPPAGAA
ncbi:hypothetical protein ACFU8Q_14280 [Streptomyces sp. NPDC057543]|uniref:hypothetical protein n=1 Tax=Streptomyces sp. NPDC057543 TaxID=3346163 RepID=UPI0036D093AC